MSPTNIDADDFRCPCRARFNWPVYLGRRSPPRACPRLISEAPSGRKRITGIKTILAVFAIFFAAGLNRAIADSPDNNKELVEAWLKVSLRHAQDYMIHPAGAADKPLTMLPQAVFRHSQPVRGDDIGAVYLWVDRDKRPAVIGTTFAFTLEGDRRSVVHEFHSLADQPLTVEWRGEQRWKPQAAGLKWNTVPKALPADKTAVGRQRESREIARRFSAESIDHKGGRWELRLLAKPIHQFDVAPPAQVLGGSLNVFCQGTDPELILAIEAQKVDGQFVWHYAAATFTDYALKLKIDDQEVWNNPEFSSKPTGPYWADAVSVERLPK